MKKQHSFYHLVQLSFIQRSNLQLCFVVITTMFPAYPGLNNLTVFDLHLCKYFPKKNVLRRNPSGN